MQNTALLLACEAFATDVVTLYALYCDTIQGFQNNAKERKERLCRNETKPYNKNWYGRNEVSSGYVEINAIAYVTQLEYVANNETGGLNHILAAQHFIAILFTSWEHKHRKSIAVALDLQSAGDLKIDVIGDLRELRNEILHHHGIVSERTISKLCELNVYCLPDTRLELSEVNIFEIVGKILAALDALIVGNGGEDPGLRQATDLSGPIIK